MKRLGYGMMRLPTTGPKEHAAVDLEQVCRLVDAFMDRGFSYFDTAYFYHEGQSEHIVRQAVAERHSRDSFLLADKMPMMHLKGKTAEDQARIFDDQLQKCGVDYFDYYLLHCLDRNSYEAAKELDTFAFLMGKKAEGRLRHLGFSFHDRAEVLDRILTEHPEAEFVQLQLNYLDWEDGTVQSRLCYETAVRHGKKVIVMEPVRGGRLASLTPEAESELHALRPEESTAAWAFRFLQGVEGVQMILSGMTTPAQMEDNVRTFEERRPLTDQEEKVLLDIAKGMYGAVPCTACRYCCDGCPMGLDIPMLLKLYNEAKFSPNFNIGMRVEALPEDKRPAACVDCGQCARACPQNIDIPAALADLNEELKKIPRWADICRQREEAARRAREAK